MKNVVLIGSTGSIGTSTVKVAEDLPDRIRLLGLAAGNNAELLLEQTRRHRPQAVSIADPAKAHALRDTLGTTEVFSGAEGLLKLATLPGADIVLIAIVGTAGLQPALAAIRAGVEAHVPHDEATRVLVKAGFEKYLTHLTGHGLGFRYHEPEPFLMPGNGMKLREGHVCSVEPGLYGPEFGGIRLEDNVVVTADGVENLTKAAKTI